jgi:hypothetical protein
LDRLEVFGSPPASFLETRRIRATCAPERIGLVNAIVDAYEGLAVVRTIDAGKGLLEFWVSAKDENTLRLVLQELSKQVELHVETEKE